MRQVLNAAAHWRARTVDDSPVRPAWRCVQPLAWQPDDAVADATVHLHHCLLHHRSPVLTHLNDSCQDKSAPSGAGGVYYKGTVKEVHAVRPLPGAPLEERVAYDPWEAVAVSWDSRKVRPRVCVAPGPSHSARKVLHAVSKGVCMEHWSPWARWTSFASASTLVLGCSATLKFGHRVGRTWDQCDRQCMSARRQAG